MSELDRQNKIAKSEREKGARRAIIEEAFAQHEISEDVYKYEMNVLGLGEKTVKELGL
jgi:uncharacterized membrane protein|tara:strand:+ start:702 stop:875 length:174 start_codon:yes stop_codon:yes gene_type:complete